MTNARQAPANAPRTWDFLLTVLFIFLQAVLLVVLVLSAFSFGAVNAGCDSVGCNADVVGIGQQICTWGPIVIAIVSVPIAITRVLRRRIAFWVSILGGALMVGAFFVGGIVMTSGYPAS